MDTDVFEYYWLTSRRIDCDPYIREQAEVTIMSNEALIGLWVVVVFFGLAWMQFNSAKVVQAKTSERKQQLRALKAKSDAHKVLVPIFIEQRHSLNKSLAESLQEMKSIAEAFQLVERYKEVSEDLLKHEGVVE